MQVRQGDSQVSVNKIKALRLKLGISQEEFIKLTGISLFRISRIERGVSQPRLDELQSIVDAFKVDPRYFFDKDYHENEKMSRRFLSNDEVGDSENPKGSSGE